VEIFLVVARLRDVVSLGCDGVTVLLVAVWARHATVLFGFGCFGGGFMATDLGDVEDGFPAVDFFLRDCGEAEACGGQGALCPFVVDVGKVPLDGLGGRIAIQLIAHVDDE